MENVFPPVPADTVIGLGAFLAGRGLMNPWIVFGLGWTANVGAATAVYFLGRRYGREFFRGPLGRRLLSPAVILRLEHEYERHGTYGVFLARLLPVWRGVVMPFAGLARLRPARALVPMALAGALYYGLLTWLIWRLAEDLDDVVQFLQRVNAIALVIAVALLAAVAVGVVRMLKR